MLTTVCIKHHITLLALQGVGMARNTHCMVHCNYSENSLRIQKKKGVIESLNIWGGSQGNDSFQ